MRETDPMMREPDPMPREHDPTAREHDPMMRETDPMPRELDPTMRETDPMPWEHDPASTATFYDRRNRQIGWAFQRFLPCGYLKLKRWAAVLPVKAVNFLIAFSVLRDLRAGRIFVADRSFVADLRFSPLWISLEPFMNCLPANLRLFNLWLLLRNSIVLIWR